MEVVKEGHRKAERYHEGKKTAQREKTNIYGLLINCKALHTEQRPYGIDILLTLILQRKKLGLGLEEVQCPSRRGTAQ